MKTFKLFLLCLFKAPKYDDSYETSNKKFFAWFPTVVYTQKFPGRAIIWLQEYYIQFSQAQIFKTGFFTYEFY
jgi:hypothetical protein